MLVSPHSHLVDAGKGGDRGSQSIGSICEEKTFDQPCHEKS